MLRHHLVAVVLFLISGKSALADEAPTFARDVRPILRKHCVKCHGGKSRKGGLDLRSLSAIQRGGESGERLIVATSLTKSHLWQLVSKGEMPPKGNPRLSKKELSVVKRWIESVDFSKRTSPQAQLSPKHRLARQVQFLLEVKCWYCHGKRQQKGGLDLRTRASILRGGKSGRAVVPGDSAASLLVQKIQKNLMPPHLLRYKLSIKPVNATELKQLRQWIDDGAVSFPPPPQPIQDDGLLVSVADRKWWAFQRPRKRVPPKLSLRFRGSNFVDAWIGQKLAKARLTFSRRASRAVILRRLFFDLWGLPPSAGDVADYLSDKRPDAYERLVERLLASPRFGERWGQHWLDAAGYADSEGSTAADFHYPLLYQYRDYVVRSHNADRPYDQFLRQQIAGDEMQNYARQKRLTPEMRDNLIATGFLRMCIDPTTSPETNFRIDRHQVLADTVEIVSSSLLGLTMRCARCHSHKYDPLPQRDYYRFQAIFAAAFTPHVWVKPKDRYVWLVSDAEQSAIRKFNEQLQIKINQALHERNVITFEKQVAQLRANLKKVPQPDRARLVVAIGKAYGKQSSAESKLVARVRKSLGFKDSQLGKLYPEFAKRQQALSRTINVLKKQKKDVPRAHGLTDMAAVARPFYLARRGVWRDRGRRVLPNVPAVLRSKRNPYEIRKPPSPTTGYRSALARWLSSRENPLTARVMVNRIWRHYFARGLVATVGDFGRTGTLPTHPELLDSLAVEFMDSSWSMKHIHRLIVLSRTYRQASTSRSAGLSKDPENHLLWRMPLRRKDAEALRDSLLQVANQLDFGMYGPGRGVTRRGDGQFVTQPSKGLARSIYVVHRRSTPLTLLATFDAPRMTTNCLQRQSSNVVSQALIMINGEITERVARRISRQIGTKPSPIPGAFKRILLRGASTDELKLGEQFLSQQRNRYQQFDTKLSSDAAQQLALADFCLVLLNSAEFLYID